MSFSRRCTFVTAVLAGLGLALVSASGFVRTQPRVTTPEMVNLRPGAFSYRVSGEFTRDGRPVMPPAATARIERTLSIMRSQVSTSEYRRCAEAKACTAMELDTKNPDLPMVKTNFQDATAYAEWLSRETGERWRLPSDEEWAFAAADLFNENLLPESFDGSDPGRRALALYDRDATRADAVEKARRPIGAFGENQNGLLDIAGNVWEWTDTCFARNALNERGGIDAKVVNCGVRVVEGRHRTYMTDFIRDPRVGGCVGGIPPVHLGFRLVKDAVSWPRLHRLLVLAGRLSV